MRGSVFDGIELEMLHCVQVNLREYLSYVSVVQFDFFEIGHKESPSY